MQKGKEPNGNDGSPLGQFAVQPDRRYAQRYKLGLWPFQQRLTIQCIGSNWYLHNCEFICEFHFLFQCFLLCGLLMDSATEVQNECSNADEFTTADAQLSEGAASGEMETQSARKRPVKLTQWALWNKLETLQKTSPN